MPPFSFGGEPNEFEIERVIVAANEKHARGDVEALAHGIIEELRVAGLEIRPMGALGQSVYGS